MHPLRVAIQGSRGSYSECAALDFFPTAEVTECEDYAEVFAAVDKGSADCMVIPIENTTVGSIYNYYDLLLLYASEHGYRVRGERSLLIRHCLVGEKGATIADVRLVRSHYAALGQCRKQIKTLGLRAVEDYDTAGSGREGSLEVARIASIQYAKDKGVEPLITNIQDLGEHNYTRFLWIQKGEVGEPTTDATKTSVAFCIKNEPGSLFRTIAVFGSRDAVNVVRFESRNLKGSASHWTKFAQAGAKGDWDLINYVDFEAPESKTQSILDELRAVVIKHSDGELALQLFGTYPKGVLRDITGEPWR